jgi:Uma2 family endonuclease
MSVAVRRPISIDEFLAWEEGQELRWEFDGFAPVAMTGGTAGHSAIQRNLSIALGVRLRGSPCQVYTADLKIRVNSSIRYPDAFVVCTQIPRAATVVDDPVVVFEVLSPGTASLDHLGAGHRSGVGHAGNRHPGSACRAVRGAGTGTGRKHRLQGTVWIPKP